jgi:3-hydroxyisobutyrate dehydrogenase
MAGNLAAAGFDVVAFDLSAASVARAVAAGCAAAESLEDIAECRHVVTMLPSSPHVSGAVDALLGGGFGGEGSMWIDSSTIDPLTSRELRER